MKRAEIAARGVALAVAILLFPLASMAQEILVPIDAEGRLERIDAELERRLRLFPDYAGFREALLFQTPDSTFVLEISHGFRRLTRTRIPFSPPQADEFRHQVSDAIAARAPSILRERSGRTQLLVATAALSLGYYGWAVPVVANAHEEGAVALYTLVGGIGTIGPFLLTQRYGVSDAEATLAVYGGTRGIPHGIYAYRGYSENSVEGGDTAAGAIGSVVEGAAGFIVARRFGLTTGRVEAITAGADLGFGLGIGIDHLSRFDSDQDFATSILIGSAFGAASGALLSQDGRYTRGDAYLLRAAGIGGTIIGGALASISADDIEQPQTAAGIAGGAAGVLLGHSLARAWDLTGGEGMLVNLGTIGGGLLGVGATVLTESDVLIPIGAALGTAGGFWALTRLVGEPKTDGETGNDIESRPLRRSASPDPALGLVVYPRFLQTAASSEKHGAVRFDGIELRFQAAF